MARGITESDVHNAADELVAKGDRPTVERIRAHLGTGSPNTVTRWLETWWRQLGPRLNAHSAQMELPEAPESVSRLAQQLWEQALGAARDEAEHELAQDRLHLDAERQVIDARESASQALLQERAYELEQARQRVLATEQRLADLQQAIELQQGQIEELGSQRAAFQTRSEHLEVERADLQRRAAQREEALTAEREAQAQHVRALEDRAHAEIDRARQETKAIRNELMAREQRWDADMQAFRAREEASRRALSLVEQEAAAQKLRADTLDSQLRHARASKAADKKVRASPRKAAPAKSKRGTQ